MTSNARYILAYQRFPWWWPLAPGVLGSAGVDQVIIGDDDGTTTVIIGDDDGTDRRIIADQ